MFNSVLVSTIVYSSLIIIFCGHVYGTEFNMHSDPRLSTVYDAMKVNYQKSLRRNLNRESVLSDGRNKRNINERATPQHADSYRSVENWLTGSGDENAVMFPGVQGTDQVCNPHQPRDGQSESDSYQSTLTIKDKQPLKTISILKYGLIGLGLLSLPFLVFKMLILPLKILIGLKAISMANSVLLATLLYKFVNQQQQIDVLQNSNENMNDNNMVPMNSEIMSTINNEDMSSNGASAEENAKRILQMIQNKNNKW